MLSPVPGGTIRALKLRPVRYTADFRLVYADGTVEIVEIKSKFVRRMQRDYALRRRVFLEQVARPGWMEIHGDHNSGQQRGN